MRTVWSGMAAAVVLSTLATGAWVAASAAPAPKLTVVSAVSCASTNDCWAGADLADGATIIATTDGGASWHVQYTTTRLSGISAIDCTSGGHCVAIASATEGTTATFLTTTDGGTAWELYPAPKSLAIPESLACPSRLDCWAVGLAVNRVDAAVARTTDGGAAWVPQPIPPLVTAMSAEFGISCPSVVDCLVTGEGVLATDNAGKTWAKHAVGGVPLGPVTCPSTRDCYAIFDVTSAIPANEETFVYTSTDGGLKWADTLPDPTDVSGLGGISCPSTATCVAVGGGFTPRPGGSDTLYALSETTTAGGRKWAEVKLAGDRYLYGDSCAWATTFCLAVGALHDGSGAIVRSTDDGVTWAAERVPDL